MMEHLFKRLSTHRQIICVLIVLVILAACGRAPTPEDNLQGSFELGLSEIAVKLGQGESYELDLDIVTQNGFDNAINLSIEGLPSGVETSFSENPTQAASLLRLEASPEAALTTTEVTLYGASGEQSKTVSFSLEIEAKEPDFNVAIEPSSLRLERSSSSVASLNIAAYAGFDESVELSVEGLPTGVSASFNPAQTQTNSVLTLSAVDSADLSTASLQIRAKAGGKTRQATLELSVVESQPESFELSIDSNNLSVKQGESQTARIALRPSGNFDDNVTLSLEGAPEKPAYTFSENPIDKNSSTELVFSPTWETPAGTYNLVLRAVSGDIERTSIIEFEVLQGPNFGLGLESQSLTIERNGTKSIGLRINARDGFQGNVSLAVDNLPNGVSASFSDNPTAADTELGFRVGSNAPLGEFQVRVNGFAGELKASTTLNLIITEGEQQDPENPQDPETGLIVKNTNDSGTGSLREVLAQAAAGSTISFDEAVFAEEQSIVLKRQIMIDKEVTVQGSGLTKLAISGNDLTRIFVIAQDTKVTLNDLTLSNGFAQDDGGGIGEQGSTVGGAILNLGTLSLNNVALSQNKADVGGAIYNHEANLTMIKGSLGGSAFNDGNRSFLLGGGMASFSSSVTIQQSLVANNVSNGNGAGLANIGGSELSLDATTIRRNRIIFEDTNGQGGGIFNHASRLIMDRSLIEENQAGFGGGIANMNAELQLRSSNLLANQAEDSGGGLYNAGDQAAATLENAFVMSNEADTGAGISNEESAVLTLNKVTVSENKADVNGGGIWSSAKATLDNSRLYANTARLNGGAIMNLGDLNLAATLVGGTQTNQANQANRGGGIYSRDGDIRLQENSAIVGNKAAVDGGGLVLSTGGDANIIDSRIENNTAGENGGGVLGAETAITIRNSSVENNRAGNFGGGFYVHSDANLLVNGGSKVAGNHAFLGGGIYVGIDSTAAVHNAIIGGADPADANTADVGAGIYNRSSLTLEEGAVVTGNIAISNGGGVYNRGLFENRGEVTGNLPNNIFNAP